MTEISKEEELIMFHTLGYNCKPIWNDNAGGYRNWFGIYPSQENPDYRAILSLVKKGYMKQESNTAWKEEVYSVTDKGKEYVVNLWQQRKMENKPKKSKRRYQAYLSWSQYNLGTFMEFLYWLKSEDDEQVEFYKKRWEI